MYRMRNGLLKISFVVYPVIWIVVTFLDLFFSGYLTTGRNDGVDSRESNILRFLLVPMIGKEVINKINRVGPEQSDMTSPSDEKVMRTYNILLCIGVPYILPAIICLVCFIFQAFILLKRGGLQNKVNLRITITILYLTLLFFICNSVYFIMAIVTLYENNETDPLYSGMLKHLSSVILTFLNSALNPVILIWRGRELKKFIMKAVFRVKPNDSRNESVVFSHHRDTHRASNVVHRESTVDQVAEPLDT